MPGADPGARRWPAWLGATLLALGWAAVAAAHDPNLSLVTLRIEADRVRCRIVVHATELARPLGTTGRELLALADDASARARFGPWLGGLRIEADGVPLGGRVDSVEVDRSQETLALRLAYDRPPRALALRLRLMPFPDNPNHQVIASVFEGARFEELTFSRAEPGRDWVTALGHRARPVFGQALRTGARAWGLAWPPSTALLLALALLLRGGSRRRLQIVGALLVGQALGQWLRLSEHVALGRATLSGAAALGVGYLALDNLLAREGDVDWRPGVGLIFGAVAGAALATTVRGLAPLPASVRTAAIGGHVVGASAALLGVSLIWTAAAVRLSPTHTRWLSWLSGLPLGGFAVWRWLAG